MYNKYSDIILPVIKHVCGIVATHIWLFWCILGLMKTTDDLIEVKEKQ
jgi:hypothetical protein